MSTTKRAGRTPAKKTPYPTAKKPSKGKPKKRMADRWDKERLEKEVAALESERKRYNETSEAMEAKMKELDKDHEEVRKIMKQNTDIVLQTMQEKVKMKARHWLKSTTVHFNDVWVGRKKMEARKADRDFYIGECVLLQEYDPFTERWSGREILVRVTSILSGAEYGIIPGFVILSFETVKTAHKHELSQTIDKNLEEEQRKESEKFTKGVQLSCASEKRPERNTAGERPTVS